MAKVKLLDPSDPRRRLDRYELIGEIATGGMATVFLARRGGVGGFQRFNAIKRLHPHLANEPEFVEMFLDEARLAALIHHPNVVPILEVGETEAGYYLVMEYVEGDTLSRIVARTMSLGQMPPRHVILRMMLDALAGLHAAHELRDDRGQLLGLVHRDCSPQNVLVGVDGSTRITDFGVARASSRLTSTAHGKLKGKLAYMAPEQTRGDELDRRTDLFAMGIILWEVLCGKRLFKADSEAATLQRILVEPIRKPSELNPAIPKEFDTVVLKALDRDQEKRFQTAADFADALEAAGREAAKGSVTDVGVASPREVASFVQTVLGQEIGAQRESVRAWLAQSDSGQPIVFQPSGSSRPAPQPGDLGSGAQGPTRRDSPVALAGEAGLRDIDGGQPSTRIEIGRPTEKEIVLPADHAPRTDRQPRTPHFEVAADVTMRFALESPKAEPPPPPSSPPPSSSRPVPPRVPPPKQSSPTLLGHGPIAIRERAELEAELSGKPASAPVDKAALDEAAANFKYVPPVGDDLEDAVTVARPNHAPPPISAQVKTQRGIAAQPLLAEARARAEASQQGAGLHAGGSSNGAAAMSMSGSVAGSVMKTPRMPMPVDQSGISFEAKQNAGAAIISGVPEIVPVVGMPRNPRTLVSATPPGSSPPGALQNNGALHGSGPQSGGEVSAGGFTPGSMTLPSDASFGNDALDPTVIHSVPKRGVGKIVVVLAAFLLVFGAGLLLLKAGSDTDSSAKDGDKPKSAATARETATATGKSSSSIVPPTPSATSTAGAPTTSTAEVTAAATAKPETPIRKGGPRTSKPTAKPETTAKPEATAKPKEPGEDLSNPYR